MVNFIRSVNRLEDLFQIKSLHYEKKKGDLDGIIVNALLFEISKHYE